MQHNYVGMNDEENDIATRKDAINSGLLRCRTLVRFGVNAGYIM